MGLGSVHVTLALYGAAMLLSFLLAIPLASANPKLEEGCAHLADKKPDAAIVSLQECIDSPDSEDSARIDCHWEMGWAYWLKGNWPKVIEHWEIVKKAQPGREGLSENLSKARSHLGLKDLLAKGRDTAAPSYQSEVPSGTTVRLRAVGDLMIGTTFPKGCLPPDDGVHTFSGVKDWLTDADVTFGNLEGPLCDDGTTKKCKPDAKPGSCYAFKTPERYTRYYKEAGFDVLSTANNHASDFGEQCRKTTEAQLDSQGIAHTGRPGDIATLYSNGLKIAVIGFHTSRSGHYLNDHETAADLVRGLTKDHDIVVVSYHGGAEGNKAIHVPHGRETFYGENRGNLREFTHTVIDAGADLVLGHGPHVVRGMEVYKDRLIAYSLGNFATYDRFNLSGNLCVGVVLETVMDNEGRFLGGQLLPTVQEGAGTPIKDDDSRAVDLIRHLSAEDFPSTAVQVAKDGTLAAP
jgi:poly-gamma-glutamate capsule biosynthesis protein CapA/YwtB (metallophosphatase superfamily)